ncbi:hypothetical protein [Pseudonocardia sp. GCM10023141]|uniref:hypothetical protein n=1 Tax=Pseudonocardia sp. GCM10023141 TaxID=3252653 RepID=UPI003620F622
MALPVRAQLDAAVAGVGMQVTRENVLQARAALLGEADRLETELLQQDRTWPGLGRCGGDPVSADASVAFDERSRALLDRCREYNDHLRKAAYALDAVARSYGYSEDEIASSFKPT